MTNSRIEARKVHVEAMALIEARRAALPARWRNVATVETHAGRDGFDRIVVTMYPRDTRQGSGAVRNTP